MIINITFLINYLITYYNQMTPTYSTSSSTTYSLSTLPSIWIETIVVLGIVGIASVYYEYQMTKSIVGLFS